jgi:hypothetical protein
MTYCNDGDYVCTGNFVVGVAHLSYTGSVAVQAISDMKKLATQLKSNPKQASTPKTTAAPKATKGTISAKGTAAEKRSPAQKYAAINPKGINNPAA